jgi:hypothetical protein
MMETVRRRNALPESCCNSGFSRSAVGHFPMGMGSWQVNNVDNNTAVPVSSVWQRETPERHVQHE